MTSTKEVAWSHFNFFFFFEPSTCWISSKGFVPIESVGLISNVRWLVGSHHQKLKRSLAQWIKQKKKSTFAMLNQNVPIKSIDVAKVKNRLVFLPYYPVFDGKMTKNSIKNYSAKHFSLNTNWEWTILFLNVINVC